MNLHTITHHYTHKTLTNPFIVVETKRGSLSPSYVWVASNEADYMQRVQQSNPRSSEEFTDFKTVIANDEDRHATNIVILYESNFKSYDYDDLCKRIHDCAARLDWFVDAE